MEKKQAKAKVAVKKATATETTVAPRGRRVDVVGEVISDKMDKTISVEVYRVIQHKKYGKFMRKSSTFKAHDEKNEAKVGDIVKIHETRPLSKTKRFALSEIVEKAKA